MFKAIHEKAPEYVSDLIQPYVPAYPLRSNNQGLLVEPADLRLEMFGRRSFSYAAPHAWNKLPVSLKTISSFPTFKQLLKSSLFKEYYHSPNIAELSCWTRKQSSELFWI